MKYTKFGKTGMYVSVMALGAMTFGSKNSWKLGGLSQEQANEMVKRAYDYGINLYDTADIYDEGESEIALGKALKPYREEIHIATKVRGKMGKGVNQVGLSRHHIQESIKGSLKRLDTDHVEIYQMHSFDYHVPYMETIETIQNLVERGDIDYPGVSNFNAWQMAIYNQVAKDNNYETYHSAQMNYSLLNRDIEQEILPFMNQEKLSLLAWSPLHGGVLSGKYGKSMELREGTRLGDRGMIFPPFNQEKATSVLEVVEEIAKEQDSKSSNIALSWILEKKGIVLIGARTMEQFEENMKSMDIKLTKEQMERLDNVSAERELYPGWMIKRQDRGRDFEIV
jgi:aryl-alcohol dehydrogenase-like predicted oxidoreductase